MAVDFKDISVSGGNKVVVFACIELKLSEKGRHDCERWERPHCLSGGFYAIATASCCHVSNRCRKVSKEGGLSHRI